MLRSIQSQDKKFLRSDHTFADHVNTQIEDHGSIVRIEAEFIGVLQFDTGDLQ